MGEVEREFTDPSAVKWKLIKHTQKNDHLFLYFQQASSRNSLLNVLALKHEATLYQTE